LIYLAHATFFYFMKDLSLKTGGGDVGLFFTICMVAMIAVRALGGVLFDRMNKITMLRIGLVLLIPCLILLPHAASREAFYLLAVLYGLCLGIILPLTIALLFSASPPPLRGLNTNLNLFTMDVAYFLLPYLGGGLIAFGAGFEILFYGAAGFVMLSLGRVPQAADHFEWNGLRFEIMDMDGRRVDKVLVTTLPPRPPAPTVKASKK
jgi:MFS family permease